MAFPAAPALPSQAMPSIATDASYSSVGNAWNGQPTKVAPSAGVQTQGFVPGQLVNADYLNYLQNANAAWMTYLQSYDASLRGWLASMALANWTARTNPAAAQTLPDSLAKFSKYIFVGGANGSAAIIITSPDGVTWTSIGSLAATSYLKSIADCTVANNGTALAITVGGPQTTGPGVAYSSPDGSAWTPITGLAVNTQLNAVASPQTVTYGGTYPSNIAAVAVGSGGVIYTTAPGPTIWTSQTSGTANALNKIAFNSTTAVAVGAAGTIVTSTNGSTWTTQTSGTANALNWVIWTGTQFVAVGAAGTILTSPTGTTWTSRTSNTANALNRVAVNPTNTMLVAVGASGTIVTSPDGITWTSRTTGVTTAIASVMATSDGDWTAGTTGAVLVSTDSGANWTSRPSLTGTGNVVSFLHSGGVRILAADNGNVSTGLYT